MARVFVSHASQDHLLAAELHNWLAGGGHNVFLDQHLQDGLALGEDWEQRLYERLRWPDAVVCLITSEYCNSAWCAAEVGIARFQGCRLLPLQAEAGCVHPLLAPSRHQYTDWVGDPVGARDALGEALRGTGATGGWDWPGGRSPFPGLRRFDTELQRVFFGRTNEIAALAAQLRSPADAANGGVLLVVGPSGCGKSSLLRAGLGPVIDSEPGWLTLLAVVPGRDPIATQLITGSDDQTGRVWSVAQAAHPVQVGASLTGAHDEIYSVAYTPDATMIAIGVRDGTIIFSDLQGVIPARHGAPLVGHEAGVDPVVFSPTGNFVATASEDKMVKLWKVADGSLISTLHHDDEVTAAAFSPDESNVFASGSGPEVYLWDLSNPAHPRPYGAPLRADEEAVVSLAFCAGRHLLVAGDEGGEVRIWNLAEPAHPVLIGRPLKGNPDAVDSVACGAHGRLLAVAGTGLVKLWSLDEAGRPAPLGQLVAGHGESINAVTFSPDGFTMAAAGDDGYVILWDVNGTQVTQIGRPFRAHGDPVTSVAFSPTDPQIFASASEDETAQMWDLSDKADPLRLGPPLLGHQRAVNSVAIGRNEKVATGSDDKTARLWTIVGLDRIRQDPIGGSTNFSGVWSRFMLLISAVG